VTAGLLALSGCTSPSDKLDNSLPAAHARLLKQRDSNRWTEVKRVPGQPGPVTQALIQSRQRVLPYLLQAAQMPQEEPKPPAPEVGPAQEARQEVKISVHFRETPLSEAIDILALPLGMNIVLPPDLAVPVTVNFPSITPRGAINAILSQNDLELEDKDGVQRIRRKDRLPDLETRTFRIKSGEKLDVNQIQAFLTPVRGKVTLDGTGTTLVVTDEAPAIRRVEAYLALMDQRKPQVLIEALIMEIQHTDDIEWGLITGFQNINIGDFTGNITSDFSILQGSRTHPPFQAGVVSDEHELEVAITADQNITRLNVLSNPLVSTVSGQEAKLEVIEKVPFIQSLNTINVSAAGGATNSSQQIEFKDVGVRLKVTPHVGGDDIIEMKIEPEVLELVDFVLATPVIDERRVTTTVYVHNNETLVLAGLLREQANHREDKVPILGDIPLLGNLFRGESNVTEKRELLVFLTPHLISSGHDPLKGFQAQRWFLDQENRFPQIDQTLTEKGLGR
jgi:type II secretory pathway component GspD/PulD (secretin)